MHLSLQQRAMGLSILAAGLSLGGALLVARPIQSMGGLRDGYTIIATSPQLVAQGAGYFGQSCGDCHGDDARGDEGPDLHGIGISDGRIAATIKHGVKGEMPSFARKYGDPQIAALVAYVRSLK